MTGLRALGLMLAGSMMLQVVSLAEAEILPAEKQKIDAVNKSLHQVGMLFRGKKYGDLGKVIEQIEKSIDELKSENNADLGPEVSGLEMRFAAAQRLLKASLDHSAASAKPTAGKPMPKKPIAKKPTTPTGGVSFVNQIAPLLADKCGRCHISRQSGGFSVASYAALRAGSGNGTVFQPGKGKGSTLVDLLESGDMPRGANRLSDAEIDMVVAWIDQGAIFDGGDPNVMLASNSGSAGPSMSDMPTGNEKVSFMRDIAPMLVGNCTNCHGGDRGAGNFELDTFERLKRGGRDGDVLSAGNPGNSILLKMLKGTQKDRMGKLRPRMPQRSSALSDSEIAKFETWISEGAKFDGDDPRELLEFQVRVNNAIKMTHEELTASRADLAKKNWAKGSPGMPVDKVERDDFVVYGNLPSVRLNELADMIDAERVKIGTALKVPPGKPLVKGKISIFVFEKRFELSEFARMVDRRELPSDTSAFFRFDVIDAFGGLMAPKENDHTFPLLVSEILCGCYVDSMGRNIPAWFSNGAARVYAAKVEPRSALVKHWDEQVGPAMAGAKWNFIEDKSVDGQAAALSYGLVKSMMANGAQFGTLMELLKKGMKFDNAVQQAYRVTPQKLAQAYTASK
ncbi:MAG TPA: c-type cytochrome domain-containing protein [Pirellulales bacterium]|nr:c-type cytochrome domain-containing protein [Pirellulales bacterium]